MWYIAQLIIDGKALSFILLVRSQDAVSSYMCEISQDCLQCSHLNAFLKVLDSIGVDLGAQLKSAPKSKVPSRATPAAGKSESDDELVARLAALR